MLVVSILSEDIDLYHSCSWISFLVPIAKLHNSSEIMNRGVDRAVCWVASSDKSVFWFGMKRFPWSC